MSDLAGMYHYHIVGRDERPLELLPDGTIGRGANCAERSWNLQFLEGRPRLLLCGDDCQVSRLSLEPDGCWRGCWRGRWLDSDETPIELVPQRLQPLRSLERALGLPFEPHRFHYISYAQLVRDCTDLARSLPPVKAVAGIPRSGLIPASIIALELNVPMVALENKWGQG